jgi:hypothetical protein
LVVLDDDGEEASFIETAFNFDIVAAIRNRGAMKPAGPNAPASKLSPPAIRASLD